jgi:hypothetical protein
MTASADLTPTDRFTNLIEGLMTDVEGEVPWGGEFFLLASLEAWIGHTSC